jgi:hypothetical protein
MSKQAPEVVMMCPIEEALKCLEGALKKMYITPKRSPYGVAFNHGPHGMI